MIKQTQNYQNHVRDGYPWPAPVHRGQSLWYFQPCPTASPHSQGRKTREELSQAHSGRLPGVGGSCGPQGRLEPVTGGGDGRLHAAPRLSPFLPRPRPPGANRCQRGGECGAHLVTPPSTTAPATAPLQARSHRPTAGGVAAGGAACCRSRRGGGEARPGAGASPPRPSAPAPPPRAGSRSRTPPRAARSIPSDPGSGARRRKRGEHFRTHLGVTMTIPGT